MYDVGQLNVLVHATVLVQATSLAGTANPSTECSIAIQNSLSSIMEEMSSGQFLQQDRVLITVFDTCV